MRESKSLVNMAVVIALALLLMFLFLLVGCDKEKEVSKSPLFDTSTLSTAGNLCKCSESSTASEHPMQGGILALISRDDSGDDWELVSNLNAGLGFGSLEAGSDSEVATILCIKQTIEKVGKYYYEGSNNPAGRDASKRTWEAWLMDWIEGYVISSRIFTTGPPRAISVHEAGVGSYPTDEVEQWVASLYKGNEMATIEAHNGEVLNMTFSPDGRSLRLVLSGGDMMIWDTIEGKQTVNIAFPDEWGSIAPVASWSDSNLLALGLVRDYGHDNVKLWDVADKKELASFYRDTVGYSGLYGLSLSPNGRLLASGSLGEVILWDLETRQQVPIPKIPTGDAVFRVAFSLDGSLLASAGMDGTVRLWDLAKNRQNASFKFAIDQWGCVGLAFSPDGSLLVCGSDGKIEVWDVADKKS